MAFTSICALWHCFGRARKALRVHSHRIAFLLQSPNDDGDAEQLPKLKKVKRKREPELPADPEEALRLKAEAARIAAEVFASAGSAAEAPEGEKGTKARHPHIAQHRQIVMRISRQMPILSRGLFKHGCCLLQKQRKSVGRRKKVQLLDGETPLVDPDDPAFMPGAQKEQLRPVLVLPPDAENIPGLKPETIEETEKRMEEKTVKWVLLQVRSLKSADSSGAFQEATSNGRVWWMLGGQGDIQETTVSASAQYTGAHHLLNSP